FDAMNPNDPRAAPEEMSRKYSGAGIEWQPLQPTARSSSARPADPDALRRAEQHIERLQRIRVDLKKASPEKAEAYSRELNVDGVLVSALGLRPVTPGVPAPRENDVSRSAQRWERARRELEAHKKIAAGPLGWQIDTSVLSVDAFALYLRDKKLDPSGPT